MQVFDDRFQAESGWNCSSILTLVGKIRLYGRTPLIRIYWEDEPSGYAENPDT
jgi:hypothetical protein